MNEGDFDAFVRAHCSHLRVAVRRTARRYGLDGDDALQEALLRGYAKRETFESEAHAVNWILRVAHDLLRDQRRSWYGRRVSASAELPDTAFESAPDPADVVARRDAGRHVLRALLALPPAHRLLLWQHAVDGRSYADIARETARPVATVRSTALRARASARRHLLPGDGSLGTALALRLRTWRARLADVPNEPIAAMLALSLCLGGLAAAPPAGAATPPVGRSATSTVMPSAAPRRSAPVRPVAGSEPAVVAAPATPSAPPTAQLPLSYGEWPFSGERWGSCEFRGAPGFPVAHPILAIGGTVEYACEVEARTTTCAAIATGGQMLATCSWTLRGELAQDATGVPDKASRCNGALGDGTLVITFTGRGTYEVPAHLLLDDDGVSVDAVVDVGAQRVTLTAAIPYLCVAENPRAPLMTGHLKVAMR